jgi:3-oxoadipate enol-lactonase
MASLFPTGCYVGFEGARHIPNVEQFEAFNQALLAWLAQVKQ